MLMLILLLLITNVILIPIAMSIAFDIRITENHLLCNTSSNTKYNSYSYTYC